MAPLPSFLYQLGRTRVNGWHYINPLAFMWPDQQVVLSCHDFTCKIPVVPRWTGRGAVRAPGAVVKARSQPSRLHEEHVLPGVVTAHGGLPSSPLNSDKWRWRDEERHTGPLRMNWQKKSSVFKFSADEEGKNSLQHLVYITAFCFSRGCVYSEALWCVARRGAQAVYFWGTLSSGYALQLPSHPPFGLLN